MALKSGGSHAGAAFVALVCGSAFRTYLGAHSPELRRMTDAVGAVIVVELAAAAGVDLPRTVAGMITVAVAIAFVWGVCYHVARHG